MLDIDDKEKCMAFKMNAMQIIEQLKVFSHFFLF